MKKIVFLHFFFVLKLIFLFSLTACSSFKNFFKVSEYQDFTQSFPIETKWIQNISSLDKYRVIVGASYMTMSDKKDVFVVSNGSDNFTAFEVKTGRKLWEFLVSGGVEGKAVIDENKVYFGARDGALYVVSLDKGELVWSYKTKSTFVSSPAVTKQRVYFQTSLGEVFSLDKKTGKKVWEAQERLENNLSIKGLGKPTFYRGKLLVGFQNGKIKAYRAVNGKLLWSRTLSFSKKSGLSFLDVDSTPVVFESKVFVSNFDDFLYCLNLQNGRVLWKKPYGSAFGVKIDTKRKRIYHSSSQAEVVALSFSGKPIWSYKTKGVALAPVIGENYLWVSEFQGALKALDLKNGKLKAFFDPGDGLVSPALILNSREIFFLSKRGNIFNLRF